MTQNMQHEEVPKPSRFPNGTGRVMYSRFCCIELRFSSLAADKDEQQASSGDFYNQAELHRTQKMVQPRRAPPPPYPPPDGGTKMIPPPPLWCGGLVLGFLGFLGLGFRV